MCFVWKGQHRTSVRHVCWARSGQVSADQKQRIASEITLSYSECNGAPMAFVQCTFRDIDATSIADMLPNF